MAPLIKLILATSRGCWHPQQVRGKKVGRIVGCSGKESPWLAMCFSMVLQATLFRIACQGGGAPFRHPTGLNLIQAFVKVGETFSLKGLDHTGKGFVQRWAG